jgi:hypothetical protein
MDNHACEKCEDSPPPSTDYRNDLCWKDGASYHWQCNDMKCECECHYEGG